MSKPPSFQFYPGDRLQELLPILNDNEAVGAWLKAVMYLWSHGPSDAERLGLAVGSGWERVGFLFSGKDGLMMLEWMEEMRAERAAFVARQRSNGRRGGRPKARNVAGKNPSLSSGITQKKPRKSPRVEDEDEDEVEDEGQNLEKKGREVKEHDATFKAQCAAVAAEHPEPPPPPPPHPAELAWPSWAGPKCKAKWAEFIAYRIREKKARFKSLDTEQKALNLCCKYFPTGMMFVEGLEHTMAKNWQSPVDPAEHKYPFSAQAPSTQPSTLKPWVL